MVRKFKKLINDRCGSEAVSFILTTAMLLCIFATTVTAFAYISQSYNASYICRRAVRQIEVSGEHDQSQSNRLLSELENYDLKNLNIQVHADYFEGRKIQLRDEFTVQLSGDYTIKIVQVGSEVLEISLPIRVSVSGMSEVYWKP